MENKYFLNQQLLNNQSVISIMGPSGTGKSVCASFLENFGYKIVPQITTRNPRSDDKHYTYISHKEFVDGVKSGKILGFYSGDEKTLTGGNGYGYSVALLKEMLNNSNAKLILFPSAYELNTPNFLHNYGNTTKIAITFLNSSEVITRAGYAGKKFSDNEIISRINIVKDLTQEMQSYKQNSNDCNFHIIFSDSFGSNREESEKAQLYEICKILNISKQEFETAFNGQQRQ